VLARRIASLALVFAVPAAAEAAPRRLPVWPTEVDRIAAPLYIEGVGTPASPDERGRVRAVQELDTFATSAIERVIVHALEDPSMQVRREALRVCWERAIVKCVPLAVRMWRDGRESTLRVAALRVVALEPNAERAALLREALRDPSESVRAQAAEYLGWAPLSEEERERARAALLAKLADLSALVRKHAVDSLGLIGEGEATLAVARLLEDPEPTVQSAAATALGRLHDDRAVPALRRALEAPGEAIVTRAIVLALAQLGGKEVDEDLLALLDDPPSGLDATQIADAIGRRPEPGDTLVSGLVERLREPAQRGPAYDALRLLGEPAVPLLQKARRRGLEPPLRARIDALLGVPGTSLEVPATWPAAGDRTAWRRRLDEGALDERLEAGARLGRLGPAWVGPAAEAALSQARSPDGRRAWMVALATLPSSVEPTRAEPWARLLGWALDPERTVADRCLAIAALSAASPDRDGEDDLDTLGADPSPTVRACAVQAAARLGLGELPAAGLVDPSPRVRVAAALALADRRVPAREAELGRLAVMRARDSVGEARAAAALALAARADRSRKDPGPLWSVTRAPSFPWVDAAPWVELRRPGGVRPDRVWAPSIALEGLRVVWAPGLGDTEPVPAGDEIE
jgi:HEAT repeat protein